MVDAPRTWQLRIPTVALVLAISLSALIVALAIVGQPALAQNDPLAHADSLMQEAYRLYREGRYREAIPKAREVLTLREQALGPTHPHVATSLNNLAELLRAAGNYSAAKPLLERALRIKEQAFGPTDPDVALGLNNLALLLHTTGDFAAAKPLYERALNILEKTIGPTHPNLATVLNNLAELFRTTGDYAGAKPLHERALRIREQALGPNHPDVATTLNNIAILVQVAGDYAAARLLYERALKILERAYGPTHPDVAISLNNLALLLQTTGDYAGAKLLHERALGIQEQALGHSHHLVATSLDNLAGLHRLTGDYARATPLYERALRIREHAFGPNHPDVATTIHNIAALLQATGDYAAARPLYERALRITEDVLGPTHSLVAPSLNNLGLLLAATGDYAAARSFYERALRITEDTLGPAHPDVAMALNNLGTLYWNTGDYAAARPLLERALRLSEMTLGPNHPRTALGLGNLAMVEWQSGRPKDALSRLARAVGIARAHTARGLVGLSNRQKLAFLQTTAPFTDALLSMPAGLVPNAEAYRAVLNRKNLLFHTLAAERALAEANPGPQVAALLEDYTSVRRQLGALVFSAASLSNLEQYQTQVASLSERLEGLESELSRVSAVFRQRQTETSTDPSEVCAAVPTNAVLIDIFWYGRDAPPASPGLPRSWEPHYVAFVLRGGECGHPVRVDLGPAAPIDEDVRRFRDTISRDTPDPAGRALRARYRQSVAARLVPKLFPSALRQAIAGKPRLLIAPDGALALLSFALLPGEEGHEFLLETRTISYVPSGRDLLRTAQPPVAAASLVGVGAPSFDFHPVQTAQAAAVRAGCGAQDEPFVPLPGTAAELKAIAAVYEKTQPTMTATLLEGPQATKRSLLEKASGAGVLHLATHAYFAGEGCTPAGLTPTPVRMGQDLPPFLGHNPLLLAGIALAGANERDKADGILTALEVTALDLRGTNLVVLSACDTGLGTAARGQELLGLRWAFAYAGARHLVTSLWTVPDAETAILMTRFYSSLWIKGLGVPAALRAAQLEMLKAARARGDSAPHTWGAFVASGQPD